MQSGFYKITTGNMVYETKDFSGKIIVKYKNGKSKTEIPYYVTVVEGGLSFNSTATKYFINENSENLSFRYIIVKNDFPTSVMLINVSLPRDAQSYFHISDFNSVILKPKEEKCIFSLKLKSGVSMTDIKLNSFILLRTNISEVEFPLLTYNGKLELHLPYKSKDNSLDLGLVSVESKKDTYILLLNRNPVSVTIKQMGTSLPASSVELLGCDKGDYTSALLQDSYKNMTKCSRLKPNKYAVLRLFIKTFRSEGQVWGDVFIHTQYELLSIPVHFKVAQGKLEIGPDRLVFDQCFPGKICSHPLRVHSTFNDPMVIEDIVSIPPDPRLSSEHFGHIMARATKVIGHLYLDPNLECQNECYLGMQQDSTVQWMKTLTLTKTTPEFDLNLVNVFYNRYLNRTTNGQPKWQNLTMRLDTSEVKGHLFKTRVKMSWPSLLVQQSVENKSIFNFPLTQVGNITYQNLTIRNPSSYNLLIHLVMDHVYPGVDLLQEGLPPDFIPSNADVLRTSNPVFFFHKIYSKQRESFEKLLNVRVHDDSLPIILYPGDNFTVSIGYKSTDAVSDSSFIFIRNNLTVLEVVHLRGRGAHPNFKFGNRKPGSPQPLQFELTEKHLKDCEREKNRKYPTPNLTVKRSFTSRNTGDVTIFINGFYINGIPCEGYGFKVLNCEPFALAPNGTKKIDIAFTPDFTLSKISRTLILDTSLNYPVNYTLMTTVPHYYLPLCTSVLSRPTWESYLYYSAICMMCFLLVFVVISMVLESDHIIKNALNVLTRHSPSTQPTLDLRLIGAQTRSEIRTQKTDDVEEQKAKEKTVEKTHKTDDTKSHKDEKYTALIPTTGKGKKKLSKKTSNELVTEDSKKHVDKPIKPGKHVEVRTVENNESEVIYTKKPNKDRKFQKKKPEVKHIEVPTYEEETSSTTTESSNNEEIEKPLKVVILRKSNSRNESQKLEELEVNSHPKLERRRSGQKHNRNKEMKENIQDNKLENQKEHRPKTNKNTKERKEKQSLSKKLSADKFANKLHADGHTNCGQSLSPTVSSRNIWGENRASFSDVVARNESLQNTTRVQSQSSKPMMYVEPYKQSSSELGPIGSRKENYWQDNVLSQGLISCDDLNQMSDSSIFTDAHNLAVESSNAFLDVTPPDNWQQRNTSIMNFIQPSSYSQMNNVAPMQDSWNTNTTPNNYWESILCNQVNENAQTQPFSQDTWCSWGSPVWQPLSPEVARTPTRRPPGFGFTPNREMEENMQQQYQQQQENVYSPFSLREIWTQQQSNPWNYPQGQ